MTQLLRDSFGRVATDLRVSLTDRCNLRCDYCMPAEGLDWLAREELLTDDEIVRLIGLAVQRLGIRTVRLTGGEPLLRRGLEPLVAAIAALTPRPAIALTTNGIGLAARAEGLAAAGVDRINISLDTLDPDLFQRITRRPRHADVLAGVAAARAAGLDPVKINAVLLRGVNEHEAWPLLAWAMETGVQLRFIEQMPLDAQHGWRRSTMITAAEIRARLSEHVELVEDPADQLARGSAPAELFRVAGTEHRVGIIAAVSAPFCGACDRVRLTADGQLRNCLFAREESDLRAPLRAGADDDALVERWLAAVATKRAGHGIDDPTFLQPDRPMSAIGG
ncbi:cyclic pyranopterin phosphate synthase [Friedmanniella endophytica]|uniref:GTP 3',8-cyclase n=1 Tax=Microlunatus kandeliicorticis TaxID=1759536 RepID=A0A7W3IS51_9ACTN|nr:GTP 3',8-cyclase MoaA [Microlunatus kandeliicorticis]MBA8794225.1 cyclic pyranopterin phosphate synthase [Microlunatus kandeliicorticis]